MGYLRSPCSRHILYPVMPQPIQVKMMVIIVNISRSKYSPQIWLGICGLWSMVRHTSVHLGLRRQTAFFVPRLHIGSIWPRLFHLPHHTNQHNNPIGIYSIASHEQASFCRKKLSAGQNYYQASWRNLEAW